MLKPYCPILTIGFAPPKPGEVDLRRCTEACALYDEHNGQCYIRTCAESLDFLSGQLDDSMAIMSGTFVPFEEEENFDYNPNS